MKKNLKVNGRDTKEKYDLSTTLFIDFETRSSVDIKHTGATFYARHPHTQIVCFSWCLGEGIVKDHTSIETMEKGWWGDEEPSFVPPPTSFFRDAKKATCVVAHNIGFDFNIWKNNQDTLGPVPPLEKWRDTMACASALNLPASLEKIANIFSLRNRKDMAGHSAMLRLSRAYKFDVAGQPIFPTYTTSQGVVYSLKNLVTYCRQDVETLRDVFKLIPALSSMECDIFLWNLENINIKGFKVDRALVKKLSEIIQENTVQDQARFEELTNHTISSWYQTEKLKDFLNEHLEPNNKIDDMQKKTLEGVYERTHKPVLKEIITLRLTNTTLAKKFDMLEKLSAQDAHIHDSILYFGGHTGRFSGKLVQPQNLPKFRKTDSDTLTKDNLIEAVENDREALSKFSNTMLNSAVRLCIIPEETEVFFGADYSNIELRILLWGTGSTERLTQLKNNIDLYIELAKHIFGKDIINPEERKIGKIATLGLGYGMGKKRLGQMLGSNDEALITRVHQAYHSFYPNVRRIWTKLESNFKDCVQGGTNDTHFTKFKLKDKPAIAYHLPSGRAIYYWNSHIDEENNINFFKYNSLTKRFDIKRLWGGTLLENICQAISRDLLASACLNLSKLRIKVKLHIHDEIVASVDPNNITLPEFAKIITTPPHWLKGLPIACEAWQANRYIKL